MRLMKWMTLMLLLCLLPCAAFGEAIDVDALVPMAMTPDSESQTLDLYCGPTQGFYRHNEQTLDTGKPYVFFGAYDCWAMVAQGTPDNFGPVGWVEAGAIAGILEDNTLGFENGFAAMVEETAAMTDYPLSENPFDGWTASIAAGTQVTVLSQLNDFLYVQTEIEDIPVRAFIPANTVY